MRTTALALAVLGVAVFWIAVVAGSAATPGYDPARQYIGELGAAGAAAGAVVSWAFILSGLLQAAFWALAIRLSADSRLAAAGFALSALGALGLMSGGTFPCDAGCSLAQASPSAVTHEILGTLGRFCSVAGVLVAAIAWRNQPQRRGLFRLALLCGLSATVLIWTIHPGYPLFGLAERALELAIGAWTFGVALNLRRRYPG